MDDEDTSTGELYLLLHTRVWVNSNRKYRWMKWGRFVCVRVRACVYKKGAATEK